MSCDVRSLLLRRRRPGQRAPLWAQRLKAQNLLATVRKYPSFPIVMETYRHAMADVFDMAALKGLLRDIGQLTSTLRSEMLSFNSTVDPARGEAQIQMTVRVSDFEHLNDLLSRLTALPNVTSARRTG